MFLVLPFELKITQIGRPRAVSFSLVVDVRSTWVVNILLLFGPNFAHQ